MNRDKNYRFNTMLNYIFRFFMMALTFITVPITLNFLGASRYGIWQTMLTIISWANIADFGIGNGLRNKISESYALNKYEDIKKFISSAFYVILIISILIFGIGIIMSRFIDVNKLFKNNNISIFEVKIAFIIILFSFCVNFILNLARSISYGLQKSYLVTMMQSFSSLITFILIISVRHRLSSNLINISIIYSISSIIVNSIFFYMITRKYKFTKPKLKYYDNKYNKKLYSISAEFFMLQICTLVLMSTDNFIVASVIGVKQVTAYSIVNNLFSTMNTLFSILLIQLWSAITEAFTKNDIKWIHKKINKLLILLIPYIISLVILALNINIIIKMWIKTDIYVDNNLIKVACVYYSVLAWNGIFVNIQNGMGKVRVQTFTYIIEAIINIPLAIMFIKYFKLGVAGVMLSNLCCVSISAIFCSLDVFKTLGKITLKNCTSKNEEVV